MSSLGDQIGVGIIGCGKISQAYFDGAKTFKVLNIVACADLNEAAAQAKAEENGCEVLSIAKLLAHPEIQLVINLTIPAAHAAVSRDILKAGKHAYCEKPLTVEVEDARDLLVLAKSKDLLIGCAPDTFFGAGIQTCREIVDSGEVGTITSGTAFMLSAGPESWHPNPGFYYLLGGGPVLDMAPYYLTALVNLIGPIKRVCAITTKAHESRIATSPERDGEVLPVEVNTHASGTLEFHSGVIITAIFSFDVHAADHSPIQLYGTKGSIKVPDPNNFGGTVERLIAKDEAREWEEVELTRPYSENTRSIGVADMLHAILNKRPHRASGALACHVLEVMHAFDKSSESGRTIEIESQPERPDALPVGLAKGVIN
jgi:predicted dehydrogenase